ncbi:hypothetical protein E0Z10_g1907 [Xylaria hypoxylon]|uniref:SRR1-like domain-containing protein n=1 Tax=Xylaria hypoxylon TaxID=37992 RepID=A0A4Z0YR88_9PEZI|nr:hypothetical protein E0Z10_g1907 [Xylaria hypoxylon]
MEPIRDESIISTRSSSEVRTFTFPSEDAYKLVLRIRQAYEADRPLYSPTDINKLLRFAEEYKTDPTTLGTHIAPDFFGCEQCWVFSQEQLVSAQIDISTIQWLITMALICSRPEKLLVRGFSLSPIQGDRISADSASLYGFNRSPNSEAVRSAQEIHTRLADSRSHWNGSNYKAKIDAALYKALAQCFTHDIQPFTKVMFIGATTIELDTANHHDYGNNNWSSMPQHAFAFGLKNLLEGLSSGLPIELSFQDPEYTDATKDVLRQQDPTVKVGNSVLDAVFGVDNHTLLFVANHTEYPLKQIIAEYATASPCEWRLPRAIIWGEGVRVTWEDMERRMIEE